MATRKSINSAGWIWIPDYNDTSQEAKFVLFRKVFDLHELPTSSCLVRISADTRYRMLVNGQRASFGPCKSYLGKWYFEEVDVSSLLRRGKNVIAVKVLRFSPAHLGNSSMIRGQIPGLILQGNVEEVQLDTDESWRVTEDRSVTIVPRSEWDFALGPPFMCLNEQCDQRLEQHGWTEVGFDDSEWLYAIFRSARSRMMPILEPRRLSERPIPPLPETETNFYSIIKCKGTLSHEFWNGLIRERKAVRIAAGNTEVVDIEAEVLTTGFLHLVCQGGSGSKITILCAESYERPHNQGPGEIGTKRFKSDRKNFQSGELYGPIDTITLREGFNTYEPFWFRTFRFVRLTVQASADQDLVIEAFHFRETHYPLDIQTKLQTSDGLEDLWKISLNTLRNCMHETYEDCPFYEQNQFAMDTRIQILFTYQLSRDDRLARKCMQEFYASLRDDGLVETHFPVPFRAINIPQFSLYWVLMICDHWLYFGDSALVRRYLGAVDGVLNHFLARREHRGLVGRFDDESWPFVDWVKEWHGGGGLQTMAIPPCYYQGDGVVTYNSLVVAFVLRQAAALNADIGRKGIAEEYVAYADSLNTAVNKHCWNGSMYTDGPSTTALCQHSQVFAILAGAIDGDQATDLMRRTLLQPDPLPKCSYAMSFYVLRAASQVGVYEEQFERLMRPWRAMITDNLTTWAEDDVMFRSDCHGWSASPIYEVVHEIFGVSPAASGCGCGYDKVVVAPRLGLQSEAKGTFVTGRGNLDVGWDQTQKLLLKPTADMEVDLVLGGKSVSLTLKADKTVTVDM